MLRPPARHLCARVRFPFKVVCIPPVPSLRGCLKFIAYFFFAVSRVFGKAARLSGKQNSESKRHMRGPTFSEAGISAVIPVYNSQRSLPEVIARLEKALMDL